MDARHIVGIQSGLNFTVGPRQITHRKKAAMVTGNESSGKDKDLGRIINSLWNIELEALLQH